VMLPNTKGFATNVVMVAVRAHLRSVASETAKASARVTRAQTAALPVKFATTECADRASRRGTTVEPAQIVARITVATASAVIPLRLVWAERAVLATRSVMGSAAPQARCVSADPVARLREPAARFASLLRAILVNVCTATRRLAPVWVAPRVTPVRTAPAVTTPARRAAGTVNVAPTIAAATFAVMLAKRVSTTLVAAQVPRRAAMSAVSRAKPA
jgi:hypothetical protein